jgi:NAD(P)-dependent dehydrogenase (short-subunit alcohol dehydrogenase family)
MEGLAELGCELLQLDVTDSKSVFAATKQVLQAAGRIDVLVNNAGLGGRGPVCDYNIAEAKRVFDVNVFGTMAMCQVGGGGGARIRPTQLYCMHGSSRNAVGRGGWSGQGYSDGNTVSTCFRIGAYVGPCAAVNLQLGLTCTAKGACRASPRRPPRRLWSLT